MEQRGAYEKAAKEKAVEEVNEEEELEERKKRDTPRDSDRREADKLKINEDEEDLEENMYQAYDQFGNLIDYDAIHSPSMMPIKPREEKRRKRRKTPKSQILLGSKEKTKSLRRLKKKKLWRRLSPMINGIKASYLKVSKRDGQNK
jgi:hypothetical protein